ncbi:MAG: hypothetical protein ACRCXD_13505 [Luteolibacter sp.]
MNEPSANEPLPPSGEIQERRVFLKGIGKWSGAAIMAAVAGSFAGSAPEARAASWINRRGGWVNRRGGWINRSGGGWINRGGGNWINRGGSNWINRGGGSWVNRRGIGGGSWINRR